MKFKEFTKVKANAGYYGEVEFDGILFDDGTKIYDYHEQDCCEYVYADWEALEELFFEHEIEEIEIENVENAGFRLNGFFVPCYNQQNGYYSDQLEVVIVKPDGFEKRIEVEKKDDID